MNIKDQKTINALQQHPVTDKYNRSFSSLRISLTAACNFACSYCVAENTTLQRLPDELSTEQLMQAVILLHKSLQLTKIRFTGGEPLLSKSLAPLLNFIGKLDDSIELSLTTNAQLIVKHKEAILHNSIKRINVSLDSLDPKRFTKMAKSGDLKTVLENIEWLLANNIAIKINMVPMLGYNEQDILPMLDFCLEHNIELRYIELMRMGHMYNLELFNKHFIGMNDVLKLIADKYDYKKLPKKAHSTSMHFQADKGIFAFIPNESEPFCSDCDRLRLTSNGLLFGCISNDSNESIVNLLQMPQEQAIAELQQRLMKTISHKQKVFSGQTISMKVLGG